MHQLLHRLIRVLLPVVCICALPAAAFDQDLYARLLEQHTRSVADKAGTRVDYAALANSRDWGRLIQSLESSDPEKLATREARMAFWINAYNVLAIDTVRRHHPVDSIKDVGSLFSPVWDREAGRIRGRAYTLGEIEHEILRPMGDPRVHAAIVCASSSCPSLLREPFRAETLDAQLAGALQAFLANPRKGLRFDRGRKSLELSRIFDWFEEDFAKQGGVVAYLKPYMPEDARAFVSSAGDDLKLVYFDYDWSLNDLARAR